MTKIERKTLVFVFVLFGLITLTGCTTGYYCNESKEDCFAYLNEAFEQECDENEYKVVNGVLVKYNLEACQ